MIKKGKLRAEKIEYHDGTGCCIWYPLGAEEGEDYDEETGICFDFSYEDIDDMIQLLQSLKEIQAKKFEE
jgi:hypothetical protein